MGRKGRNSGLGKINKYWNLDSLQVAQTTTVFLPTGSRIISVRGANSGADTYSFKVTVQNLGGTAAGSQSITYTNIPNGQRVALKNDFPFLTNIAAAPAAAGDSAVSVTAGQDSAIEVYYSTGTPLIDVIPPTTSLSAAGSDIPPAVKQWLNERKATRN